MDTWEWVIACLVGFCFLFIFGIIIDQCYCSPVAADRANEYCKSSGFDQYKAFSRVGFFSETPVAIQCEYAEKYTDLGVRASTGG
jgi:hypothetical protein